MKKFLCLVLALVLATSVFAACGKKDDVDEPQKSADTNQAQIEEPVESETPDESPAPVESSTPSTSKPAKKPASDVPSAATPAPSSNKEVVTEDSAPDVYLVIDSDDNAVKISYHLKDCSLLKDKQPQKVAWEMVKTLGFRQCPKCNPPQYEGYIE